MVVLAVRKTPEQKQVVNEVLPVEVRFLLLWVRFLLVFLTAFSFCRFSLYRRRLFCLHRHHQHHVECSAKREAVPLSFMQ